MSLLSYFLLSIFISSAWAVTCPWLEKEPLTNDTTIVPSCVDKCHKPCEHLPGELLCSGRQVYMDDEEERLDMSSTDK